MPYSSTAEIFAPINVPESLEQQQISRSYSSIAEIVASINVPESLEQQQISTPYSPTAELFAHINVPESLGQLPKYRIFLEDYNDENESTDL